MVTHDLACGDRFRFVTRPAIAVVGQHQDQRQPLHRPCRFTSEQRGTFTIEGEYPDPGAMFAPTGDDDPGLMSVTVAVVAPRALESGQIDRQNVFTV